MSVIDRMVRYICRISMLTISGLVLICFFFSGSIFGNLE